MPVEICEPGTEEWHEFRRHRIGASDAAGACGCSDHVTELEMYDIKADGRDYFDPTDASVFGVTFERAVADMFCHQYKEEIKRYPVPLMQHDSLDWMVASLDAVLVSGKILECKTKTDWLAHQLGDDDTDSIPIDWIFQAQHQHAVSGIGPVEFGVLIRVPQIRRFIVEPNDVFIEEMKQAEAEFMDRARERRPPDPDWEHRSTAALIKKRFPQINGVVRKLSDASVKWWKDYERLGAHIRRMEAKRKELKARVLYEIGSDAAGELGDGRMVRRKRIFVSEQHRDAYDYVGCTAVKIDANGKGAKRRPIVEVTDEMYSAAIAAVQSFDAKPVHNSEAGSHYYELPSGRQVRISNHAPNAPTLKWMARENVLSVRLDLGQTVESELTPAKES